MRKLIATMAASALVFAACGGGSSGPDPAEDPKGALTTALQNLADAEGISMTFSLDAEAEDLESLAASEEGSEPLPEGAADKIVNSSITISANSAEKPEDVAFELIGNVDGEDAFHLSVADLTIYVQADVPYLFETFGQDPARIEDFAASVPAEMSFVNDLIDGEWIAITGLDQLVGQLPAQPQDITAQQKKALQDLTTALEDNAEVETGDEEGPGDHLIATIPVRALYEDLQPLLQDLQAQSGAMSGAPGTELPPASEIPEGDATIDFWIDDGNLTQIEVDFIELAREFAPDEEAADIPEDIEEFGIRLGLEEFDGEVEVPDDASEVSFQELMTGFMGAGAGLGMTGEDSAGTGSTGEVEEPSIPAFDCEQLKDAPPEVLEQLKAQFEEQCPEVFQ